MSAAGLVRPSFSPFVLLALLAAMAPGCLPPELAEGLVDAEDPGIARNSGVVADSAPEVRIDGAAEATVGGDASIEAETSSDVVADLPASPRDAAIESIGVETDAPSERATREPDATKPGPDATDVRHDASSPQRDGAPEGGCIPSCFAKPCGASDGCGGACSQGTCMAPNSCGGGGVQNVCGCTRNCQGKACGAADGCGATCNQGTCSPPNTCGGGGVTNACGCTANCQGKACGAADGCGGNCSQGACAAPNTCGGGGTPNACGCTPNCPGSVCGTPDQCGGMCTCTIGLLCVAGMCLLL
jgi:hypothetical protein